MFMRLRIHSRYCSACVSCKSVRCNFKSWIVLDRSEFKTECLKSYVQPSLLHLTWNNAVKNSSSNKTINTMVRYYENVSTFQFNWDQVAQGFWLRYPNPNSTHVLTEDTVSREVRNGILYTKRLLTKTSRVPKWGERFISKNVVKVVEESTVDPKTKTMITYTRNLGYTKVMSVVEKVVYRVSEENPNWTVAKRSAWIDSQVFGFSRPIQAFGVERLKKNCAKMYTGFNYVLAHMFPYTAQYMNPSLSQMGFAHMLDEGTAARPGLAVDLQHSLQGKAEKMKDAAKKATDLAKQKAGPIYATCQPNQS